MEKTAVYEFMLKENADIKDFADPADHAEDYENEKNDVKWQIIKGYHGHIC